MSTVLAIRILLAAPVICCAMLVAASANDSTAELSVGGLSFTRNADISMESEELTITPEFVTVRYVFLNQSQKSANVTIAFPLPEIDLAEADNYAIPTDDPVNFVAFQTKIDGKPITFTINQRAFVGEKDVSAKIKNAGLPILPVGAQQSRVSELNADSKQRLIDDGLLIPAGSNAAGQPLHGAAWTVRTSIVRQQTFPPGKPVMVEHRYRTSMGVSFDTVLRKSLRENAAMTDELKRYRAEYCVQDDLLRGIDRIAGSAEGNVQKLRERRITYVLKTGANWAGPIKDFKVVIDKGSPDRLISFCLDNVKKISPTAFEVRKKDFTPERDLKILLIGKAD